MAKLNGLDRIIENCPGKSDDQIGNELDAWFNSMLNRGGRPRKKFYQPVIDTSIEDQKAEQEAKARLQADKEFLDEVVDEIAAAGFARNVAYNMCNTEAKMMEQARKYKVI